MNTQEISITVDSSIATKASRLFDCKKETILNELLQNSRRAHAEKVILHVFVDLSKVEAYNSNGSYITNQLVIAGFVVDDDGQGIEDPSKLLCIGGSDWKPEKASEDPAGLGLFSLSQIGGVVRSKDWTVNLTPEVFKGEVNGIVESTGIPRPGTQVFVNTRIAPTMMASCVAYYPVEVEYRFYDAASVDAATAFKKIDEGDTVDLREYNLWLDDDTKQPHELRVKNQEFLPEADFDVYDFEEYRIGIAKKAGSTHSERAAYNFYGIIGSCNYLFTETELAGLRKYGKRKRHKIRIDIKSTENIHLKLPDRTSLVEAPILDVMAQQVEECYVRTMVNTYGAKHNLAFSVYEKYKDKFNIPQLELNKEMFADSSNYEDYDWKMTDLLETPYLESRLGLEGVQLVVTGALENSLAVYCHALMAWNDNIVIAETNMSRFKGYDCFKGVPEIDMTDEDAWLFNRGGVQMPVKEFFNHTELLQLSERLSITHKETGIELKTPLLLDFTAPYEVFNMNDICSTIFLEKTTMLPDGSYTGKVNYEELVLQLCYSYDGDYDSSYEEHEAWAQHEVSTMFLNLRPQTPEVIQQKLDTLPNLNNVLDNLRILGITSLELIEDEANEDNWTQKRARFTLESGEKITKKYY